MAQVETYKKIAIKFKQYCIEINKVWDSYSTIEFYSHELHSQVKKDKISCPEFTPLSHDKTNCKKLSKNKTYGTFTHIQSVQNPRNALISSYLIFEKYISILVEMVYTDFPRKSISLNSSDEQFNKISEIIFSSADKDEIVDRIIEEKLRGLFYGNVADLFLKDKAKLELKNTFKSDKNIELISRLTEIIARRNVYIHNGGRVDRKYIRETHNETLQLGQIISTDSAYIKDAINIFSEIARVTTNAVIKNLYNAEPTNQYLRKCYWKNNI